MTTIIYILLCVALCAVFYIFGLVDLFNVEGGHKVTNYKWPPRYEEPPPKKELIIHDVLEGVHLGKCGVPDANGFSGQFPVTKEEFERAEKGKAHIKWMQ